MIYKVVMDGNNIYDLTDKKNVLINPKMTLELNSAGSLEFVMPPMHGSYDDLKPAKSIIKVERNGKILLAARPMEVKQDFYKNKTVYCEGLLALLNDTYIGVRDKTYGSIQEMLQDALDCHNALKPEIKFQIAKCTVTNKQTLYRYTSPTSCWDFIKNQIIAAEGGWLYADYSQIDNKVINIYYLSTLERQCNQPIKFGLNMLDYTYGLTLQDICTAVIAWCNVNNTDEDGNTTTTRIESDLVRSEPLVNAYGLIIKVLNPGGCTTSEELTHYAQRYISDLQFDMLTIEGKAADLFSVNPNYEDFEIGMSVEVISEPHGIDKWYPLTKVEVELDSAEQSVTVGSQKRLTLTSMQTKKNEDIDTKIDTKISDLNIQTDDDIDTKIDTKIDDKIKDLPTQDSIDASIDSKLNNYDLSSNSDFSSLKSEVDELKQSGVGSDRWEHYINGKDDGKKHRIDFIY